MSQSTQVFLIDVLVIVALTVLAALKIAPVEATLTMIGAFAGARVAQMKAGPPGPPPAGGGTVGGGASTAAALFLGLAAIFKA